MKITLTVSLIFLFLFLSIDALGKNRVLVLGLSAGTVLLSSG